MKPLVLLLILLLSAGFSGASDTGRISPEKSVKVLILSGSNNHDWASTSKYLQRMYAEAGLFLVAVTEKPDTLKAKDFEKYDVVVSNWNSFPKTDIRWPEATEKALLDFIRKGGGADGRL